MGFANLGALRAAHARLVKHVDAGEATDEFLDEVEGFLICAQDTGRVLEVEEERMAAQTIIDYWGTVMLRARRPLPEATAHGLAKISCAAIGAVQTTSDSQ